MPYYQLPRLLCGGLYLRRAPGAEMLVRASSSETAEGSGGQPASHVKMRRSTGEQCDRPRPEPAAPGQAAGPS